MKVVLDLMGVLFLPARIIYDGFAREVDIPYEIIKAAYKKASLGDAAELNRLIPVEEQRELLLRIVKPTFDFSRLKGNIYILSNMPALWGVWLIEKYLAHYIDGAFISGFVGREKPDEALFRQVAQVVGQAVFLDDREENVEVAKRVGWKAYVVKGQGVVERLKAYGLL